MSLFICPVCGGKLHIEERSYACEKGHRFDMAKQGYVNLLMNGASSQKRHGDDKRMIRARRDFLNAGFYAPLLASAKELLSLYIKEENSALDIGCGEAYYTAGLAEAFPKMRFAGIDISKDALIYAKKRMPGLEAAVASGFKLPCADESFDLLIHFFAPLAEAEFCRVLKKGGWLLRAVPLEDHLYALKALVYEKPYRNKPYKEEIEGFSLAAKREISYTMQLEGEEDRENLFMMTPYYYKTGREDQEKLFSSGSLSVEASFGLFLYQKI